MFERTHLMASKTDRVNGPVSARTLESFHRVVGRLSEQDAPQSLAERRELLEGIRDALVVERP